MIELLDKTPKLESRQMLGLCALIFMSQREQTSVAYQHKEWNFSDIPQDIIDGCDQLKNGDQIFLANYISELLLDEDLDQLLSA